MADKVRDLSNDSDSTMPILDQILTRTGMDLRTFSRKETYQALGIGLMLFSVIAYAGLSVFGLSSSMFAQSGESIPIDELEFQTLNRTGIEDVITNETGWFRLSEHRGKVIILDMMAHDCSNCHGVQSRIEDKMNDWYALSDERELIIIGYGSYYSESLEYLNTTGGEYSVPLYSTGLGTSTAAVVNGTERADPNRLFTPGGTGVIPVVMVIDTEGFIIASESSSTPAQGWNAFDDAIQTAMIGDIGEMEQLRNYGVQDIDQSMKGIIFLGAMLSILVYFSPCAFPVLPGFISYYLTLGAREDELIESGKLKGAMPGPLVIGALSGLGMWTFFAFIGIIAWAMGKSFATSGIIHDIAIFIAALLLILGFFMLTGGTSHLMSWVQRLVDRFSTTEMDENFTPRRNMYLYGIGYAAASIDCTAAAVLPFIGYLATIGGNSVIFGLGSLMIGLLILMVAVVSMVGFGRQQAIGFLRRATGMIKLIGAWMMMMAGAGLLFYLTNTDVVAGLF
jgi:cytochrome c-type biogenesis protein